MQHTLITSERSPFGRICRLFMIANKIDFQLQILNFVDDKNDAEKLSQESPINKVPILMLNDEEKIFDSRVIINYLIQKNGLKRISIREENIISALYSCLDVSVVLFLMKNSGYDLSAQNFYLTRQKDRIPRNLEFVADWATQLDAKNPEDWNYASMSLYSFLYWAEKRARTIQISDHPHFAQFMENFARAPGVEQSSFT